LHGAVRPFRTEEPAMLLSSFVSVAILLAAASPPPPRPPTLALAQERIGGRQDPQGDVGGKPPQDDAKGGGKPGSPDAKKGRGQDQEKDAESTESKVVHDSDADAREFLRSKEKGLKDKEPRVRSLALEEFVVHRHESYVKPLSALLKDKNTDVVKLAARALGNQPFEATSDVLLDFAANPRAWGADPRSAAEAILSLGNVGLGKRGYGRLRELFDDCNDVDVRIAIFKSLAKLKEKKAFSFFVDHNDEPAPANPDSPSNPPASYWKARFEEWNQYKEWVRRGLREMTGESFATKKQWVEWSEGPGKKLGFVYSSGG
jgi:hypothetical protein